MTDFVIDKKHWVKRYAYWREQTNMETAIPIIVEEVINAYKYKNVCGWTNEDMRAVFIRFCHGQIQLMSDFEQWLTEYRKQKGLK